MLIRSLLAMVLAAASFGAAAADYYVIVPLQAKTAELPITVELNGAMLPEATWQQPYAGYDFNSALRITGDLDFTSAGVAWSTPIAPAAGLTIGQDGYLTGTPSVEAEQGASFSVKATYKRQE